MVVEWGARTVAIHRFMFFIARFAHLFFPCNLMTLGYPGKRELWVVVKAAAAAGAVSILF